MFACAHASMGTVVLVGGHTRVRTSVGWLVGRCELTHVVVIVCNVVVTGLLPTDEAVRESSEALRGRERKRRPQGVAAVAEVDNKVSYACVCVCLC